MSGYEQTIKGYTSDIVYDIICLNTVHNATYWFIQMNKGDVHTTLRLNQVLLPNITVIKIHIYDKLPKKYNEKYAGKLEDLKISNDNADKLLEEIHRRYKFDTEFDIQK